LSHEYPLLLSLTVLFTLVLLLFNWVGDVLIALLNPKAAVD